MEVLGEYSYVVEILQSFYLFSCTTQVKTDIRSMIVN